MLPRTQSGVVPLLLQIFILCRYFSEQLGEEEFPDLAPGRLSQDLREALGIAAGAPPPWLHRMQALGYPPGYRCGAKCMYAVLVAFHPANRASFTN